MILGSVNVLGTSFSNITSIRREIEDLSHSLFLTFRRTTSLSFEFTFIDMRYRIIRFGSSGFFSPGCAESMFFLTGQFIATSIRNPGQGIV